MIVDVPVATGVARPAASMVATDVFADAQVTWPVRSCVELSEKVPVAVNGSVSPLGTLGLAGVTAIDCRTAGPTVSTVWPVTPPKVALIVEVPVANPLASPSAVIVATDGVRRHPGHLAGQVLGRAVGEGAGGGERLGRESLGDAGVAGVARSTARDRCRPLEPPSCAVHRLPVSCHVR